VPSEVFSYFLREGHEGWGRLENYQVAVMGCDTSARVRVVTCEHFGLRS
jgi:hypothetical protein